MLIFRLGCSALILQAALLPCIFGIVMSSNTVSRKSRLCSIL
jgi:hypothetical protein